MVVTFAFFNGQKKNGSLGDIIFEQYLRQTILVDLNLLVIRLSFKFRSIELPSEVIQLLNITRWLE